MNPEPEAKRKAREPSADEESSSKASVYALLNRPSPPF
jgi:hypothetical protein